MAENMDEKCIDEDGDKCQHSVWCKGQKYGWEGCLMAKKQNTISVPVEHGVIISPIEKSDARIDIEFDTTDIVRIKDHDALWEVTGVIHDEERLFLAGDDGLEFEVKFVDVEKRWALKKL